jgi:hypothetical protein
MEDEHKRLMGALEEVHALRTQLERARAENEHLRAELEKHEERHCRRERWIEENYRESSIYKRIMLPLPSFAGKGFFCAPEPSAGDTESAGEESEEGEEEEEETGQSQRQEQSGEQLEEGKERQQQLEEGGEQRAGEPPQEDEGKKKRKVPERCSILEQEDLGGGWTREVRARNDEEGGKKGKCVYYKYSDGAKFHRTLNSKKQLEVFLSGHPGVPPAVWR